MRTGVIIDQYKLLAMRLLPSSFFTAFVLKHGKPLLPTEHLSWARVISPQLQSELQPYTAPISGYRGRPVAELLVLRVPEKHYPISQQVSFLLTMPDMCARMVHSTCACPQRQSMHV